MSLARAREKSWNRTNAAASRINTSCRSSDKITSRTIISRTVMGTALDVILSVLKSCELTPISQEANKTSTSHGNPSVPSAKRAVKKLDGLVAEALGASRSSTFL